MLQEPAVMFGRIQGAGAPRSPMRDGGVALGRATRNTPGAPLESREVLQISASCATAGSRILAVRR